MANEQNLKPSGYKFTDEDREKAKRARQENLLKKKAFSEIFDVLLGKTVKDKKGEEITVAEAMAMKMVEKAMKGDTKAFEVVRDTNGQKPKEKVEQINVDMDYENSMEYIRKLMKEND